MKWLAILISLFSLLACKKNEEQQVVQQVKTCYECSGFPLSPDENLDIGCYLTKQEAMDSVPVPEFRVSEAEFDAHCRKK